MKRNLLLSLFLLIIGCIIGFYFYSFTMFPNTDTPSNSTPTEIIDFSTATPQQKLIISCSYNTSETTTITPEELDGQMDHDLTYSRLTNVVIEVGGNPLKLEDAIRDGDISIEEIHAFAQLDAKNGFCTEVYKSKNGLTKFTYQYPNFDLWIVNDVYETPDGLHHRISDMGLCKSGASIYTIYTDTNTGIPIDLEDWGLAFEVINSTSTTLTLQITQHGGQQIGELETDWYAIYPNKSDMPLPMLENVSPTSEWDCKHLIAKDSSTQITIDWTETYGVIPAGSYIITLSISDIYDKNEVHPLMKNFADTLSFPIQFTIF